MRFSVSGSLRQERRARVEWSIWPSRNFARYGVICSFRKPEFFLYSVKIRTRREIGFSSSST
jgi:hypothetical protein